MTSARLLIFLGLPLIVGGRATIVGLASGTTSRSIANCLRPVTMSSASIRFCAVPSTVNADAGLSSTFVDVSVDAAAGTASEP